MLDGKKSMTFPVIRHVVGDVSSAVSLSRDEDGFHPLQVKYAAWTEDFVDKDQAGPFPLRSLAPGVVEFLATAGHFTQRDIRFLSERLKFAEKVENFDAKNPIAFYDALLGVVESFPWLMPALEMEVVRNRTGMSANASGITKDFNKRLSRTRDKTLGKLMLSKLRFKGHDELVERVHELVTADPVPIELWVGAFCEYALDHYFQLQDRVSPEEFHLLYEISLGNLGLNGMIRASLEHLKTSGDMAFPLFLVKTTIEAFKENTLGLSDEEFAGARELLVALVGRVNENSKAEDFRQISELSALVAEIAEVRDRADNDLLIEMLEEAGVEIPEEGLDDAAVARFRDARVASLIHDLMRELDDLGDHEARLAELHEQIAEESKARRYDQVRELIEKAEALEGRVARVGELRRQLDGIRDAILADDADAFEALLGDLSDAEQQPEDPVVQEASDENDTKVAVELLPEEAEEEDSLREEFSSGALPDFPAEEESPEEESSSSKEAGSQDGNEGILDADQPPAPSESMVSEPGIDEPEPETLAETSVTSDQLSVDEMDLEELEEATAPDPAPEEETCSEVPLGTHVLSELIDRGLIGIAADAAAALEACGHHWPIEAAALFAAAASRAPHGDYGPDTQRFLAIANRAATVVKSDVGANILFGALLRPAILQQSFSLRSTMPELARGPLGPHLKEIGEAIADLDFDFPPTADTLARLSGAPMAPKHERIAARLEKWVEVTSLKTSRWSFATAFMHHLVSEAGPVGKALSAIKSGSREAALLAKEAIDSLSTGADIESLAVEYAATINRPSARLHSKGVEYLQRHFDEAVGMLSAWQASVGKHGVESQGADARLRATVGNLHSRLGKAREALSRREGLPALQQSVARWLCGEIEEAMRALEGADTGSFPTVEEALVAERDLLPETVRRVSDDAAEMLDPFLKFFAAGPVPSGEEAFERAMAKGAFEVAYRLALRKDIDAGEELNARIAGFTKEWIEGIESRERWMKLLSKVDYDHQEEIARRLSWCEDVLGRLRGVAEGNGLEDLDDIPLYAAELDQLGRKIEEHIREDQADRIRKYRNEQNGEEADRLIETINDLTLEAVEDRIAQLRDGRSAATFEAELEGVIKDFTPGFVSAASGPGWPTSLAAFERALSEEGVLFTDESRRTAAVEFFRLYHELCAAILKGRPAAAKVRAFFEEIGFEDVRINGITGVGRTRSWKMTMMGNLQSGNLSSSGWFLPPIFGSNAKAGYAVFLVGPDTLPETVHKALDPEVPTILVVSGVADMVKRRDFAERLRANAIPAVLIDEALVAFAATRRETRARTIFECGLPYGRVEPYITDAGQLPPEMFFGREAEIRSIMEKSSRGCLVYGGRQLGKSALLNHIAHTRHAPEENRIVVRRDVKLLGKADDTAKIWDYLKQMLSPEGVVNEASRDPDTISRDIRAWLNARPGGQIVCLFDETDNFMDAETRADYPQLTRLKVLMEDTSRAFKVVFAGLHNVRRMYRQPNSPLAHLGKGNCIGPLNQSEDDKRAAHDLLIAPMRAAGFKFESIEAVEEILAWANYYPSLIQEYASGLLETLHGADSGKTYRLPEDGPLWTIPSSELFTHRGFKKIESRIREKFHYTLDLDPRYALVAYTLGWLAAEGHEYQALVSGFRANELLEHALVFWPENSDRPSQAAFDALLEELFDLGVLGRVQITGTNQYTYCLRTRQVATMLGSREDIEAALFQIQEKDPTVSYDRTIHRRRYAPPNRSISDAILDLPYSPLTDFQIERMLRLESPPVQLVCGLGAFGLKKVGSALKCIAAMNQLSGIVKENAEVIVAESRSDLRSVIDRVRKSDVRTRIIVRCSGNAQEANEEIKWFESQSVVLDGQVRPILLLDAANAEMRALASRRSEQTEFLAPWGSEMLRVHLSNIDHTEFDTPELRKRILEKTGGIPSDTVKLVAELARSQHGHEEVLSAWSSTLRVPEEIAQGSIGRALLWIDDTSDPGEYDTLNDFMREDTGADLVTLGPDLLAMGVVATWNPKAKRIRRSAFGELLVSHIEQQSGAGSVAQIG